MLWTLLLACGPSVPADPCADDTTILLESDDGGLTCADAKIPTRYVRVLAGRPLPAGSTAAGVDHVRTMARADFPSTRAWLADLHARGAALENAVGLEAAEQRSAEVWRVAHGDGPITDAHPPIWNHLQPALSVRASDDEERLALTESDIEGWIQYASLCHEAEGHGVLRISIANRADVYRMVSERFSQGNRAEKVALASLGAVWDAVRDRWRQADADTQQAWIADAPLPGAGASTSTAYIESVIEGDVAAHAATLHRHLGPLTVRDGDGAFQGTAPIGARP